MAADGKLLQGQIAPELSPAAERSTVEMLLSGLLRSLLAEASSNAAPAVLDAPASETIQIPRRLQELGGRKA